jgi:Tn3 transposase DDE domain
MKVPTRSEERHRGNYTKSRVVPHEVLQSLHLLQVSLVYANTLMIQQVLKEGKWRGRLTAADLRALSPLKWQHINPYGTCARLFTSNAAGNPSATARFATETTFDLRSDKPTDPYGSKKGQYQKSKIGHDPSGACSPEQRVPMIS